MADGQDDGKKAGAFSRLIKSVRPSTESEQMANLREQPSQVVPMSLEARTVRERRIGGAPVDGRRLRSTGRTMQVNIKVTPEFKKLLERLARQRKSSIVGIIEHAVECYVSDSLDVDKEGESAS